MRIVVDENIPNLTVGALQTLGHHIVDIRKTIRQGLSDADLLMLANSERALLITTDKGFVRHRNRPHHGILIIRLRQPNLMRIHDRIMRAVRAITETEWPGMIVVMRDRSKAVIRAPR